VVVAFYSIAPTQFARDELPSRSLAGGYSVVPGYLVARLALTRSLHGQGLGTQLLLDGDAHRFYVHHDFQPIQGSHRLLMKVATARAALGR